MAEDKVKLNVLGISHNALQTGAFLVLLAQENGPYRIPVVIGAYEAQAIAIQLEHIITPRPLTHDLFCSFSHAFSVELTEVFISRFEDGIFSAEMVFSDGEKDVRLDARTSDAIAIALRTGAPIYTTTEILHKTGTVFDPMSKSSETGSDTATSSAQQSYEDMSTDDLRQQLEALIKAEDYEEAAKINEILKKRDK